MSFAVPTKQVLSAPPWSENTYVVRFYQETLVTSFVSCVILPVDLPAGRTLSNAEQQLE